MPTLNKDKIEFTSDDRVLVAEQSSGMDSSDFLNLFNTAIQSGDTTNYFKVLEEIVEKDPDVNHSIGTRSSEISSKEWIIEGPSDEVADELTALLKAIKGDPIQGLITLDQLIASFLGDAYLTGISMNEIVTDGEGIVGFNHIPTHFLTFKDATTYPKLFTSDAPDGVEFNQEKMIYHMLNPGTDPARGWLGHAVGIQYFLKLDSLNKRITWQAQSYAKSNMIITMPGDKDTYEAAYEAAEDLIIASGSNGAVLPEGVTVTITGDDTDGKYFFENEEDIKRNIVKIILGQTSTSDSKDSNRSTAEVHITVLETRTREDMELIEDTITRQLITKMKELHGISEEDNYQFKFVISELEAETDELDTEDTETEVGESVPEEVVEEEAEELITEDTE